MSRKLEATFQITFLKATSQIAVVSVVTEAEMAHGATERGRAGLLETDAENARLRGIQRTQPPAIAPERRSPEAATLERAQHWQNHTVSHDGISAGGSHGPMLSGIAAGSIDQEQTESIARLIQVRFS